MSMMMTSTKITIRQILMMRAGGSGIGMVSMT